MCRVAEARAEVLLALFFPKSEGDVLGGDHKVFPEAQGAALSTIECKVPQGLPKTSSLITCT